MAWRSSRRSSVRPIRRRRHGSFARRSTRGSERGWGMTGLAGTERRGRRRRRGRRALRRLRAGATRPRGARPRPRRASRASRRARRRGCSRRPREADLADRPLVDLELDSLRRYPEFVAGLEELTGESCGYRTEGTLWVALNRDQDGDLERLSAMQRAKGLPARRLSAAEVLAREPHLSGRIVAGLLIGGRPPDRPARARQSTRRRDRRAWAGSRHRVPSRSDRACGGRAWWRSPATVRRPRAPRALPGRGPRGGVWSEDVDAPVPPLGLRPVKGQLVRLARTGADPSRRPLARRLPGPAARRRAPGRRDDGGAGARRARRWPAPSSTSCGRHGGYCPGSTTWRWPSCRSASGPRCAITCR